MFFFETFQTLNICNSKPNQQLDDATRNKQRQNINTKANVKRNACDSCIAHLVACWIYNIDKQSFKDHTNIFIYINIKSNELTIFDGRRIVVTEVEADISLTEKFVAPNSHTSFPLDFFSLLQHKLDSKKTRKTDREGDSFSCSCSFFLFFLSTKKLNNSLEEK